MLVIVVTAVLNAISFMHDHISLREQLLCNIILLQSQSSVGLYSKIVKMHGDVLAPTFASATCSSVHA